MSAASPLVVDWMRNRLKWTYSFQPSIRPFTLGPGERVQVPSKDYTFSAPEGSLLLMSAIFDSPYGGFSIQAEPNLDVGVVNTILNNLIGGTTVPTGITYVRVPPDTPPGIYSIHSNMEQPWVNTCRLYVLNSDPVNSITCLGYGYIMLTLREERRDESIVPLKQMAEAQHMMSLYPELREPLRRRMGDAAEEFIGRMKLRVEGVK